MPQRILETVFVETRDALSDALDVLEPHLPGVIRRWRQALRSLNLDRHSQRVLGTLDLYQGIEFLRHARYTSLRHGLKQIAGELASAGIQSEEALGAFYLLLEQCLPYLESDPKHAIAVARVASVISGVLISGYSAYWETTRVTLADRLVDARRRLHGASAYVTQVYEMERRRLSHDLHDEIGHDLMLLKLYLEVMLRDLRNMGPEPLEPKLEQALGVVQHAIDSTRRLVLDLGPAILEELGFQPAIRSYARQFQQRTGIHIELRSGPLPDEIPMTHQVALYRVLQGALGNVFRHAQASRVFVTIGRVRDGELFLVVEDNGVGFDIAAPRREESVGLIAMRERIEVLGGSFRIDSAQPGTLTRKHGTRIEVGLPLPQAEGIHRSTKRKRA